MLPANELADRRSSLSDSKRDLLERRLRGLGRAPAAVATSPREAAGTAPLSSAQHRMWFFHQLEPDSAVYNIPFAVRLTGNLDVEALRAALNAIVQRHEVLRTRIVMVDGAPVQKVMPPEPALLPEEDLSGLAADRREPALRARLEAEARRPFDLAENALLRCSLFRLAAEVRVLLVVVHHIASDLTSGEIFLRELGALYAAGGSGAAAALPPLATQYADYALWERQWLGGPGPAQQLAFWKRQLAGAPGLLDLPADASRPPGLSFRGALARRIIAADLAEELTVLSRREGVTPFMTLLAAFQVLLARLAQQPDIVVGIPTAGRAQPSTENLIGLFVNTLPIRTDMGADPLFRALLQQVRENTLSALSNQEIPFDRVVDEVKPVRGTNFQPLVQVMFTLQSGASSSLTLPGVTAAPVPIDPGTARFDLTLIAEPSAAGIELVLEYSTDLYSADSAQRLLSQYEVLLEEIAADPDRPVSKLPILAAAERQRLLVEWNATRQHFAGPACLQQLVAAQAAATPAREAIVAGRTRLSYGELEARAGRLARRLRAEGAAAEQRVGLFVSRGEHLVPAVLGILKSGAAYVPMDPAYPADRVAFMLDDSRAAIVVTERSLLSRLPAFSGRVICIDDVGTTAPAAENAAEVGGKNLAYVIYTSGSTGKPKGVAIEHRNAVAFVRWAQTVFSARELSGVLAATSVCFDLSIFEIFAPLSCGGKIILAENALALPELPAASEVRLMNTVPSAAAELARAGTLPEGVETINLAGEALPQELVRRLYALGGIKRVYDLYGPTETTTYSTVALRTPQGRPTIGRPIANTELYLLDRHLQPVPIGVTGELYIGGAGVARGYLERPALTAERFLRNPFVLDPSARIYRTGDLCRYRSDGALEYLGRADHQVKIRGFRVELGEVEAALTAHPAVVDTCVVAREDVPGERRLVAYFTPRREAPGAGELRSFLQRTLPESFVPSAFVPLQQLPRTSNGKVDRKALPAPEQTVVGAADRVLPRDALERDLTRLWESVLSVRPIGVTDRFFDLGGHSLLAVRLTLLIEKELGKKIGLAALLRAPTVAELASLLREPAPTPLAPAAVAQPPSNLLEIQPKGAKPPLFLVHGMGGGILWGYANLAPHLGDDQPVFGFQADEPGPGEPATIEAMAARYVAEMRRRQPSGPYRIGGYCFGGNVAFEMARQLEAAGGRVESLFLISAWPANSGHNQMRWTPAGVFAFVLNLGRWCARIWEWAPAARAQFFRWKWQSLARRLRRGWHGGAPKVESEVEVLVDLSETPEGERRLWRAHLHALNGYRPGKYSGAVKLLRTTAYPLFSSFEPTHGWNEYAAGGVEVSIIPGRHSTVLSEPHVRGLARELRRHLDSR